MSDQDRIEQPDPSDFRGTLLTTEPWDPTLHDKYQREVQNLLIEKLPTRMRWSLTILSVVLSLMTVVLLYLAWTMNTLPALIRACFVEGAIFHVVAIVWSIRVIRSGVFHRRTQPVFLSGLMWCFAVLLSVHFFMLIPEIKNVNVSILFVGVSLATLLGTGVQLLRTCIEQSELNTHERLLETMLRISDVQNQSP